MVAALLCLLTSSDAFAPALSTSRCATLAIYTLPRLRCASSRAPPLLLTVVDDSMDAVPFVEEGEVESVVEPPPTPISITAKTFATFFALVTVKTATDLLTNCVARPPADAMALATELAVFPLIAIWLLMGNLAFGKRYDIVGVFQRAATERPWRLAGIGLVYALDSMFYYFAQSNIGAVTYTVLAQTKIFFTVAALRLRSMLGELDISQLVGLMFLFTGATLVAMRDVACGVAATGGNRGLGIVGLLFAQACTATANVAYEKELREPGCDPWERNIQLTGMITIWLFVSAAIRTVGIVSSGGTPPSAEALLTAFRAPWVWLVLGLKALTAVLIALTLKVGGNVLYAISKPWPVVIATLVTCVTIGRVPSVGFIAGVLFSVLGITLYYVGHAA